MFKSIFSIFALMVLMVGVATATALPKDTLIVERYVIAQNGSGSGKNIATHVFTARKLSPTDCDTAKLAYAAENVVVIAGNNYQMTTVARCEAINYSTQY